MNKTFTNSMALLNQIKSQLENNKDAANRDFKDPDNTDMRSYGSIKRANASNTTSRHIPNHNNYTANISRNTDDYKLRAKFEADFENLEQEIY
jgi:hypothetical protein